MKKYSFYDIGLAEAMYYFVGQDAEYEMFEKANIDDDVSIAEYCYRHFQRFKTFCEETYGFSVYEPQ